MLAISTQYASGHGGLLRTCVATNPLKKMGNRRSSGRDSGGECHTILFCGLPHRTETQSMVLMLYNLAKSEQPFLQQQTCYADHLRCGPEGPQCIGKQRAVSAQLQLCQHRCVPV